MIKNSLWWVLATAMALGACKPKQNITLPTVVVEDTNPKNKSNNGGNGNATTAAPNTDQLKYNPSYTRRNDLIHTKLDVRFNWEKQHLLGKATLRLKPVFYDTDSLRLDAKGFDIHKLVLLSGSKETPLQYKYDDKRNLYIKLDRVYTQKDEYTVYIEYTAKPEEIPSGGSNAITSDKGLYFINPLGKTPNKPKQIWTQGETEASSKWFPTIDRPNERCTQEISITVEDKYKTLSNGLLKSSNKNADGTRTDYWVMDLPHAPYLFMMAVGEFAVVKDDWKGMLLEYFVEAEYESEAKDIFPYTPEMLTFFSDRFGVKYPWQKYSQIIVRDYVSGAMENTTAVIFGDFVQQHKRDLVDNSDINEGIVAHEMMHHWFGDLVTCESWSNLPLNESFANYSEYLWFEYKHGKDAADYHRMNEITGYLNQSVMQGDNHPLIYFNFEDKEDMFDAHSYNKGGAILHMLRKYLGDKAYFEGLRTYLETHKYTAAEVHDLRLAFEKVTGEDLNWFFNQWFFQSGHPKLRIERAYDAGKGELRVTVRQTQDFSKAPLYTLPFFIDIYTNANQPAARHRVVANQAEQTFVFKTEKPVWVAVDAERDLLCERKEEQSAEEFIAQFKLGKAYLDRHTALNELQNDQKNPEAKAVFVQALDDKFWSIRNIAINNIDINPAADAAVIEKLKQLAANDPRSQVRMSAIEKLAEIKAAGTADVCKKAIDSDVSNGVVGAALNGLNMVEPAAAAQYAQKLENSPSASILLGVSQIYQRSKDEKHLAFYEKNWPRCSNYNAFLFFDHYFSLLSSTDKQDLIISKLDFLKGVALDKGSDEWSRYGAASAIKKMGEYFKARTDGNANYNRCTSTIQELKEKETNSMLKSLYSRW